MRCALCVCSGVCVDFLDVDVPALVSLLFHFHEARLRQRADPSIIEGLWSDIIYSHVYSQEKLKSSLYK